MSDPHDASPAEKVSDGRVRDLSVQQADVVIVGAGHAGSQAAIALRIAGFSGSVVMVGEEPEPPYERPPLSKEYLANERPFDRLVLRPPEFWEERNITILTGRRVVSVDASARRVRFADGATLGYSSLIWAAGGKPRKLTCAGGDLQGVHTVRTRADVDRIKAELDAVERVVVIGGGYIGLEMASVLTKLGKRVVVLEALGRVLARVAGPELSRFFEAQHRARGVDVRTNARVDCIVGEAGKVSGVKLADGEVIPCGMVVVGIGIAPAVEELIAAGAHGDGGVLVDAYCRTSLPDVYAVGDCALHANRFAGGATVRLESVQNANDQASTAAKAIAGQPTPYEATPWFWSNQFDLRLQTVGLSIGCDETVVRGDPSTASFSIVYLRNGRIAALDCVNAMKDYVQGRKLVMESAAIDKRLLADASRQLKELIQ